MTQSHEKQKRFLSQAIQLEEGQHPGLVKGSIYITALAVVSFIIWSALTNIHEVARTPGEIVPEGFQQTVQHLEGGIVKEIHVKDGDTVKKGQTLIVLDGSGVNQDLIRAKAKDVSLDLQEIQLRAFLENKEPDWHMYKDDHGDLINDQKQKFQVMMTARLEESSIIKDQIAQKEQMIIRLNQDFQTTQKSYVIIKNLYEKRKTLNERGYASDIQFLETQQRYNEVSGKLNQIQSSIAEAQGMINEYKSRLNSLSAQHRDDAHTKLESIRTERTQNDEIISKIEDRVRRLSIQSPTDGVVRGMIVNTIGAVINPGQKIVEILPTDDDLIVQLKIPPQHIGHVKTGQSVQVKFSSFDFSRYGSVEGHLDYISASTFEDDNGTRHYNGRVVLSQNHVGDNHNNKILPGMTVMADIVTGEKTILDYLLKPIQRSLKTAFAER